MFIQLSPFAVKFTNGVAVINQKIKFSKFENHEFQVENDLNICQVGFLKNETFCSIFSVIDQYFFFILFDKCKVMVLHYLSTIICWNHRSIKRLTVFLS